MKKNIINTLYLIILVVFSNTTFSSTWNLNFTEIKIDKTKTIKELKLEVKEIEEEKVETSKELEILKKETSIIHFFKINLNIKEKNELNKLVLEYKKTKDELNQQLLIRSKKLKNTEETIKKLLNNEREIYKKLLQFVKIEKYEEYTNFIKEDLSLINTNFNLESSGIQKEAIIKNKVANLKETIKEHNSLINKKIKTLVYKKIDVKINQLTLKDKFKQLDLISKIKLFEKLIWKINSKKEVLEDKWNKTVLIRKKITLYKIIIKRLKFFRNDFINKTY